MTTDLSAERRRLMGRQHAIAAELNRIGPNCGWSGPAWDRLAEESERNARRIHEIDEQLGED